MQEICNAFPGYEFVNGPDSKWHNMYRGTDLGFGGYVDAEPGMYGNVALLDAQSMHPTSIICMNYFGDFTPRYKDIYDARVLIKHHEYDKAKKLLGGALAPYLEDEEQADALSKALKIPLNSTYGLTSASFDNACRDKRNVNNIVALRGALFMRTLKDEVIKRGYKVIHIKTDSLKIPDASDEIIKFVQDFGLKYGYVMEHEATYDRMCLVNNAVYIAKYKDGKHAGEWTATGTQFQVPYVFKTLFSKEPIEFKDLCEAKEVKTSIYLDMNEKDPNQHNYKFVGKVGEFCPMLPGYGGGLLLRESTDKEGNIKYDAVTGTKDRRWLESEIVKELHLEDGIDTTYYQKLVDEAVDSISQYGDFEWFVSNDPYIPAPFNGGIVKGE